VKNDLQALAALADPTRRLLFERIIEAPRSVGELVAVVPVSQPAVSQHLKVLREAGLVRVERRGTLRIHHPRREGLRTLVRWLAECLEAGPKATA